MSKQNSATRARALIDLPLHDARCGECFDATAEEITSLVAGGMADAHPDAVAAADDDAHAKPAVKRTRPTKPTAASDAGDPTPKD